jgi:hypothetical protein
MVPIIVSEQANNATATYSWSRLAQYSDFSWHPEIKSCKDIGSIPDGSKNMAPAVRSMTTNVCGVRQSVIIVSCSVSSSSSISSVRTNCRIEA